MSESARPEKTQPELMSHPSRNYDWGNFSESSIITDPALKSLAVPEKQTTYGHITSAKNCQLM